MISFSRGVPAPECLPVDELAECASAVLLADGRTVLSYGSPPVRFVRRASERCCGILRSRPFMRATKSLRSVFWRRGFDCFSAPIVEELRSL